MPLENICKNKLGAYKHNGFWQCMDTKRDKENFRKNCQKNFLNLPLILKFIIVKKYENKNSNSWFVWFPRYKFLNFIKNSKKNRSTCLGT